MEKDTEREILKKIIEVDKKIESLEKVEDMINEKKEITKPKVNKIKKDTENKIKRFKFEEEVDENDE